MWKILKNLNTFRSLKKRGKHELPSLLQTVLLQPWKVPAVMQRRCLLQISGAVMFKNRVDERNLSSIRSEGRQGQSNHISIVIGSDSKIRIHNGLLYSLQAGKYERCNMNTPREKAADMMTSLIGKKRKLHT